jgi:hypothetical protein
MLVEEDLQKRLVKMNIPTIDLPTHRQALKFALSEYLYEDKKNNYALFITKLISSALVFFFFFFFSINRLGDLVYPNVYAKQLIDKTIEKIIEVEPRTLEEILTRGEMLRLLEEARLAEDLQYEGVAFFEEPTWIIPGRKIVEEKQQVASTENIKDQASENSNSHASEEGKAQDDNSQAQDSDQAAQNESSKNENNKPQNQESQNNSGTTPVAANNNKSDKKDEKNEKKEMKKVTYTDKKGNKKMLGIDEKDNQNPVVVIDNQPPGQTGGAPGQSGEKSNKEKKEK